MDICSLDGLMGTWLLPDVPDSTIDGVLYYVEGSIILKSTDHFTGIKDLEIEGYPVIMGFTSNGKKITFLNCKKPNQKINMPGLIEFTYKPLVVIVGEQYKKDDEIYVTSVNAHYFGLEKWIAEQPFQSFRIPDSNEIIINYKMSPSYICKLEGFSVSTKNDCRYHMELNESIELKQKTTITIDFDEARHWQDAIDELYNYGAFLTLCMGTHYVISDMNAKNKSGEKIDILYNYTPESKPKLKPQFFIDFNDIRDNYEKHLKRWYARKGEIAPIIDYFVEAHNVSGTVNIITGFLKMVQALESFSRKTRKETLVSPQVHAQRIDDILLEVNDKENKKWLASVLETPILNEPSCTSRITSLLNETNAILGVSKSKLKSLAYKIVVSRNYYTHFNEDLKESILSDHDLYYATTVLKYILRIHLFRELEIGDDHIKEKLMSDSELCLALGELRLAPQLKMCSIRIEEKSPDKEKKGE